MNANEQRLFKACEDGNEREVCDVINNGKCDINATDSDGNTALMFAVKSRGVELVKRMIENGADVNRANSVKYCPLVVAVMGGMTDITEMLIENGAFIDRTNPWIVKSIEYADNQGFFGIKRLLENAEQTKGKNSGDEFLQEEEGLSDEEKEEVYRQLFDACTRNNYQAVEDILVVHGDWIDVNKRIHCGQTALWNCIDDGDRAKIADLLLERGADPNIRADSGSSPYTLIFGDMYCVPNERIKLFIEYGADVDAKDGAGMTALMYFSARGDADMVKYLLSKKADVYAVSNIGYDALSLAQRETHKNVIRLLKKAAR